MNFEEVFNRFKTLCRLQQSEAESWSFLCSDAIESVTNLLKAGTDTDKHSGRLSAAAGALAFYRYISIYKSSGSKSFSAGDLRIDNSVSAEYAEQIWKSALNDISDLIDNSYSVFLSVPYKR